MYLLFNVSCSYDEFDGCVGALVEVTPLLAARILGRFHTLTELQKTEPDAEQIEYYDPSPTFLPALPEDVEIPGGESYMEVADPKPLLASEPVRTDRERLVIARTACWWRCDVGDLELETHPIDYSEVRAALGPHMFAGNAPLCGICQLGMDNGRHRPEPKGKN